MTDTNDAVAALTQLFREQMQEAKAREERLMQTFTATLASVQQPRDQPSSSTNSGQSSSPAPKPISVDRPCLSSSSTLSDFTAWEEAWHDYALCQQLASQSRETRVSALRQAFDEDLKRFIREGVILTKDTDDVAAIIAAVKKYIRRQRNPLLDRLEFYDRRQQHRESFDSFFTSLKELFHACDFAQITLCTPCTGNLCDTCPAVLASSNQHILRDRIVVGLADDETRRKLLAVSDLTLETTIKMCRAEEAARMTEAGMTPSSINAAKSAYQQQKHSSQSSKAAPKKSSSGSQKASAHAKCPKCGRSPHTKADCPAKGKECRKCKGRDHFEKCCPKGIACLKINSVTSTDRVNLQTQLDGKQSSDISWLPDTGSDVDAIGRADLKRLGGNVTDLRADHERVESVNGEPLQNLGKISAQISHRDRCHSTTLHVYDNLDSALLSRDTLKDLGFLPPDWPRIAVAATSSTPALPDQPTPEQRNAVRAQLLAEFSDVFDNDQLKPMSGEPMHIQLHPDANPFKLNNARWLPYAYRDQVKAQLDDMVEAGIIREVTEPTEWCHPIVVVPKKGSSEVRMTVDFTKLNQQVARPAHPMRAPRDVVSNIGKARYFTALDARHGYWQVPLDTESQPLTTFITQWGRYQYLRNPQGLISAGDVFNQRTDAAFADIDQFAKVVDDCLVYSESFADNVATTRQVLLRAREHGVTLSAKKFQFAEDQISFCGYTVNQSGWKPDPDKMAAIREFPLPANRTDLRSFMGLVNQCSDFSSSIAEHATPLRGLLKTKHEFLWLAEHTAAMDAIKDAFTDPPVLSYFDPSAPTRLETDAARTKGLGFGLFQFQEGSWRLVQCGSRFISDTESRYAMIELEMLGVSWAIRKCHNYLAGMPFEVIVDHQPLVPILNTYTLDQIENPRLQRLITKVQLYQFRVSWRKGAEHAFADALSRAPIRNPTSDDELGEDDPVHGLAVRACLHQDGAGSRSLGLEFHEIRDAARTDEMYQHLIVLVRDGFPAGKHLLPPDLAPFWNGREHLTVDNGIVLRGSRLVIPESLRRRVLNDLHASHQGLDRTKRRARQIVYWPRMNNDIDNLVRACPACREYQSSQPPETPMSDPPPTIPFESVSADMFSCQGWEFLVYSDRLSGWPCVARLGRTATSHDVVKQLRRWFADVGVPRKIVTDGGPQFSASRFRDFCCRWGVEHCQSTPHYPQSNGHAESAVKAVKRLVQKTTQNGDLDVDAFQRALLEWRNTPRSDGKSPAQILFGRPLLSFLYAHRSSFAPEWQSAAHAVDESPASEQSVHQLSYARDLKPLRIGDHVDIQDPKTKRWSSRGVVVAVGARRDYNIKLPSGRILWRNRRFLRPFVPLSPSTPESTVKPSTTTPQPVKPDAPRRSTRASHPVDRLNIQSHNGQSYT